MQLQETPTRDLTGKTIIHAGGFYMESWLEIGIYSQYDAISLSWGPTGCLFDNMTIWKLARFRETFFISTLAMKSGSKNTH